MKRQEYHIPTDSKAIVAALANEAIQWRIFGLLLVQSGLRPGEALDLFWGDIDAVAKTVFVRNGKTGSRTEAISDELVGLLVERRGSDDERVFERTTLKDAKVWCSDFAKRNGLDELSVHSLRHLSLQAIN